MRMTPPPNQQNNFHVVKLRSSVAPRAQKKKSTIRLDHTGNLVGKGKSKSSAVKPSTTSSGSASSSVSISSSALPAGSIKIFGVLITSQWEQEPSSPYCVNAKKRKLADAVPQGHETGEKKSNKGHSNWDGNKISSSSSVSESVSTKLILRDETWPVNDNAPPVINSQRLLSDADKTALDKIRAMKHYGPGEEEGEIRKGVSTELKLRTELRPRNYPTQWNIFKKLTQSDVGHLSRLMLSTNTAENHVIPFLNAADPNRAPDIVKGVRVTVRDADTNTTHGLVFRMWKSSNSYLFNGNWSRDFVKRRGLGIGDAIGMCWDPYHSVFQFSVLKRAAAAADR